MCRIVLRSYRSNHTDNIYPYLLPWLEGAGQKQLQLFLPIRHPDDLVTWRISGSGAGLGDAPQRYTRTDAKMRQDHSPLSHPPPVRHSEWGPLSASLSLLFALSGTSSCLFFDGGTRVVGS